MYMMQKALYHIDSEVIMTNFVIKIKFRHLYNGAVLRDMKDSNEL
jgi:hypothetical protein